MADHAARYFASRFTEDPRRDAVWRYLVPYISRYVSRKARVLELGAGYCSFINRVPAVRRVAVDQSPETPRYAAAGVDVLTGHVLDILRTLGDDTFDFVFASNFLEHLAWPELDRLLPEVRRVLVPGGRLGLVQPNFRLNPGRYFDDYTHRSIFTDVSLADWLVAGRFAIVRVEPRFMPLTVKSRLGAFHPLIPLYLLLPWRPFAGQMLVIAERPGGIASDGLASR